MHTEADRLRLVPGGFGLGVGLLRLDVVGGGTVPQRQRKFPGRWGFHPPVWHTTECASEGPWRIEWPALALWGERVSERFAASQRQRFFLQQQGDRLASQGPFVKGCVLLAASRAGASVRGSRFPLVPPRLPSARLMGKV